MAFKKGNKLAALGDHTKKRVLTQQLISELNEVDANGVTRMRKIIRALVSNAEANDNAAIKEIFDRLEGKPVATVEAGPELAKMLFAWAE
jgi:hypothetical protein